MEVDIVSEKLYVLGIGAGVGAVAPFIPVYHTP